MIDPNIKTGRASQELNAALEGIAGREAAASPQGKLVTPELIAWLRNAGIGEDNAMVKALRERDEFGKKKYGKGLTSFDKYDFAKEASEELLDAMQYIFAVFMEACNGKKTERIAQLKELVRFNEMLINYTEMALAPPARLAFCPGLFYIITTGKGTHRLRFISTDDSGMHHFVTADGLQRSVVNPATANILLAGGQ